MAPREIPFLGTTLIAVGFGFIVPHLLNGALSRLGWLTVEQARMRAIEKYGNHALRVMHTAEATERPVSITLDNRKVYIGFIAGAPNLEPHDCYVALIPFLSGHRDSTTLDLRLTVDYLRVYEQAGLDPQDFVLVLPVSNIRSISYFDHAVYPMFEIVEPEAKPQIRNEELDVNPE